MDEYLLHYIWKNRYYHTGGLETTDGQLLEIINAGKANADQGPDFLFAKVRIGSTLMVGHIEIHVSSSDWLAHGHAEDPNYNNVILHVVWKNDKEILLPFPTLELQPRISKMALNHYRHLKKTQGFIPCEKLLTDNIGELFLSYSKKLVISRLEQRNNQLHSDLHMLKGNWEQLAWRKLAHYLGGVKNGEAMETLFDSIPFHVIQTSSSRRIEIEALLFGQAGFLHPRLQESYPKTLLNEYIHLRQKYKLLQPRVNWMFLRMRPFNFPTLKIARLAALLHAGNKIMSYILSENHAIDIRKLFDIPLSSYWESHVVFGKETRNRSPHTGNQTLDNIMINVISPLLFAYGSYHNMVIFRERAVQLLVQLKGEENYITKNMKSLGFLNQSAADSQAIIQLYKMFCIPKKCLSCAVGISILHPERISDPIVCDDGF